MAKINQAITLEKIQNWLGVRPTDSHKGLFGRVVVVGSDKGMPGAVRLSAEGALRVGAGLVTVITHPTHSHTITYGRPELLCYGVNDPSDKALDDVIKKATIIVLGPGLGQTSWSQTLFDYVMQQPQPKIIDADGLNLLAKFTPKSEENWILTPHPGEAARLLGCSSDDIQQHREESALQLLKKYNGTIVLKGAQTIIANAEHPLQVTLAGNPGMASPGMGDLLTGIIAGLVAQGLNLWQAACAGAYLHATAADIVASSQGQRGLLASDLISELPRLINTF